jgi:PAS domain S-box-containing protein
MAARASDGPEQIDRRLSIATEAAQIGIWDWNMVTGEMVYSQRAKLICGFDLDSPVTIDMARAVTHPDDLPQTWAMAKRATDPSIRAREVFRYRVVRADTGETRWVLAYGQATFDAPEGGTCLAYTGTIQDITEQKLAEDRLIESEARLRLAVEAGRMAVWEVNVETDEVTHSPELNVLCGYPADAHPTLDEFRSRYAPGELERIQGLGAEAAARGDPRLDTEIRMIWPDGTQKWLRLKAQLAPTSGGRRVIGVLYDVTERRNAQERTELIAHELRHRVKNTLSILQSIATQSMRGHDNLEAGLAAFNGRLQALAEATAAVSESDWEDASIISIIDRVLAPHRTPGDNRFEINGPDVLVPPRFANALALALHELATNATKYGALTSQTGRVSVTWTLSPEQRLSLEWKERDGPPVVQPERRGFGTRMIERGLFAEFDGHAAVNYHNDGLACTIVASIAK